LFVRCWEKLSIEKRKQIPEQHKVTPGLPYSQRANSASTTTRQSLSTENLAGAPAIPATVFANRAQVDAQSVVSNSSAQPVVSGSAVPGSTIQTMLSNAAHYGKGRKGLSLRQDDTCSLSILCPFCCLTACAGSLIDGGANGGLCGSDVLILLETGQHCNVTGITNNVVTDLPIVQAASLIQSSIGSIIGIFNQYASIGN
jgi:hypothetical protein